MTYNIDSAQRIRMNQETEAIRRQHDILKKRIRLFGRAALCEAVLLLGAAYLPYMIPDDTYMARTILRVALGQSVINGLLGIILLFLYAGIRKRNLLCGAGTLFTVFMAALCSPLLRVSFGLLSAPLPGMDFIIVPVWMFLILYLLPFSILVFQFPSFLHWKKMKERYLDEPDSGLEGLFEEKGFRPGPVMVVWLVLLAAGGGICIQDEMDYSQAWDMSGWERFTLTGTGISVVLPPENVTETAGENDYMIEAGGDRFTVSLISRDLPEEKEEEPEEDQLDEDTGLLMEPKDGTMEDGTPYHQTAVRQKQPWIGMDMYTRSFETDGRLYMCIVVVFGRTDSKMEQKVETIFDSIRLTSSEG